MGFTRMEEGLYCVAGRSESICVRCSMDEHGEVLLQETGFGDEGVTEPAARQAPSSGGAADLRAFLAGLRGAGRLPGAGALASSLTPPVGAGEEGSLLGGLVPA